MRCSIVSAAVVMLVAASGLGVMPAVWHHASEADFSGGEFKATGVNSRGDVALGREVTILLSSKDPGAPAVVSAMVVAGKDIYAAAGPDPDPKVKGLVYKISGKTVVTFATVPADYVTTLARSGAGLLAGAGGGGAGIYAIDAKGTVKKLWSDPEVTYVWAIVRADENTLYAATGVKGRVYEIDLRAGKGKVVYDAGKLVKNILCLIRTPDGTLCAGTDEDGLVIEIDAKAAAGRVVLNADEKEIAAILPAPDGGYFVATSDTSKANADGKVAPTTGKTGQAATGTTTAPAKATTRAATTTAPKTPAKAPTGTKPKAPDKTAPNTPDKKRTPAPGPAATTSATVIEASKRAVTVRSPKRDAVPIKPPTKGAVSPKAVAPTTVPRRPTTTTRKPAAAATSTGETGNAVYYVQKDGLARTIFRKPLTILDMIRLNGDELVLATGNGGGIYSVTIDGDLVTRLADTDAKQVTAVGLAEGGQIAFATANAGSVGTLAGAPAKTGTFLSKAQDAKQFARWGSAQSRLTLPPGTRVTFATRSGNVAKPDEATWGPWSGEQALDGRFIQMASRPARFLQYRFTLHAAGALSPAVHDVVLSYQVGNLAPAINALGVKAVAKEGSKITLTGALAFRQIDIAAADPNGDALAYTIEYRQLGEKTWLKLTDKLTKPVWFWNTLTLADGRYELRVTVSDKKANAPAGALEAARVSEPVVVDNTPPLVQQLAGNAKGRTMTVIGRVADQLSRIRVIQYTVDGDEQWRAVLPADGITDSLQETFRFEISKAEPGTHRIAVRAVDALGNTGYAATTVTVAPGP